MNAEVYRRMSVMTKIVRDSFFITLVSAIFAHFNILSVVFLNLGFTVLLLAGLSLPICWIWVIAPRVMNIVAISIYSLFSIYMWNITPIQIGHLGVYSFKDYILGWILYIIIMYPLVGKELIASIRMDMQIKTTM